MRLKQRYLIASTLLILAPLALGQSQELDTVMVAMRDGVTLATDVYLPEGDGPFPVVLTRTFYPRGGLGAVGPLFNTKGMAFVVQDNRGRGESQGEDRVFADDGWGERQDGADTVTWIREQAWCNGKIGTFGMSALGITQYLLSGTGVDLEAQVVWVGSGNFYGQLSYRGGVFRKNLIEGWTAANKSSHIVAEWKAHPSQDDFWRGFDSDARATQATAPTLHIGGWWDIFAQGTIDAFVARQHNGGDGAKGTQRLVMGAWSHGGAPGNKVGELPLQENQGFDMNGASIAFLDHWLLGGASDVADGPAVRYYTVGDTSDPDAPGNEWRTADDWPPFETVETPLYLGAENLLVWEPQAGTPVSFTFDPAEPCPTRGGTNLLLPPGSFDQREIAERSDVLAFATEPLEEPVEITGRVKVRLFVSSDAPDTDFTARLLDIYPDGRAMAMVDGIQRVKYRNGFEKADPLAPGTIGELEIDLWSISLIVNKGHRIGLHVSSSNYPAFEVNPNTGEDFPTEGGEMRKAVNAVHMDADHPSALLLPVRPMEATVAKQ
jgi:hypothetical protein